MGVILRRPACLWRETIDKPVDRLVPGDTVTDAFDENMGTVIENGDGGTMILWTQEPDELDFWCWSDEEHVRSIEEAIAEPAPRWDALLDLEDDAEMIAVARGLHHER